MRLYFFNHFMLSGIQQGIQAGHAAVELMLKYDERMNPTVMHEQSLRVKAWAEHHKTFIVLNAGDNCGIANIQKLLSRQDNTYAWTYFREPMMDNMVTSVCVLLPEMMYSKEAKEVGKQGTERDMKTPWFDIPFPYTEFDAELLTAMSTLRTAYG